MSRIYHYFLFTIFLLFSIALVDASTTNSNSNVNLKSNRQPSTDDMIESRQNNRATQQEREQLYEAYNLLHTLAQVLFSFF